MKQYQTFSEKETKDLAAKLAKQFKNRIIALTGDLGSGKTTFVQGFAEGLGVKDKIISPTFVLIRQHKVPYSQKMLFHVDLYRIENFSDLGLKDLMQNPDNFVLIEWAEKIKDLLPKNTTWISFENRGENIRKIVVK